MGALVIGIGGKPRSGKDTVAALLHEAFPELHRTTYSQVIRKEYDAVHGTRTYSDEAEKVAHRHGLATWANQKAQEDPEYLNRKVLREGPLLVTGIRRPAEAAAIHKRGGVLLLVTVSQEVLAERMGVYYHQPDHHVAEHFLDDFTSWDYVIENNGTLTDLKEKVAQVVEQLRQRFQL